MMTIGTLVLIALLWFGHRRGVLSIGSVIIGVLVGLAASGPAADSIGKGVRDSASAIGAGIQTAGESTYDAIVKDRR